MHANKIKKMVVTNECATLHNASAAYCLKMFLSALAVDFTGCPSFSIVDAQPRDHHALVAPAYSSVLSSHFRCVLPNISVLISV